MDKSSFEHSIFPNVEEYLEHCRKNLQGSLSILFSDFDPSLKGLIVNFAIDTAKLTTNSFLVAPEKWVLNFFEPLRSDWLKILSRVNEGGDAIRPYTSSIVKPLLTKVQKHVSENGFTIHFTEGIYFGSFIFYSSLIINKKQFDKYYRLSPKGGLVRSLADSVIYSFLQDAHVLLMQKLTSDGFLQAKSPNADFILKRAGDGLLTRIFLQNLKGYTGEEIDDFSHSMPLFSDLNIVSRMPYEGASAFGNLMLCEPKHPNVKVLMKFTTPIWSREHHQVRKLLEIAKDEIYLLWNKGDIYGLGCKNDDEYDLNSESLFEIEIFEHGAWRLKHGDNILMVVCYDRPSLHVEEKAIYLSRVKEALQAEDISIDTDQINLLLQLVEMAMKQKHGTMLVISDHADEEANRLEKHSVHIEPTSIDNELMKLVTAIDGAVLLDFDGLCYAIGVILDGTVKPGDGDSSRGARYLAAIKYLNWSEKNDHKCLIIVVSEDGMINIFPEKKSE